MHRSTASAQMTEAAYIDTSCLLKLLLPEPESSAVAELVAEQKRLVVSSLAELEARSQLFALRRGGALRPSQYRATTERLDALMGEAPFEAVALGGEVFDAAIAQVRQQGTVHCRTLDRLHLGAMQLLGIQVLLTTDRQQAAAARGLDLRVRSP